MRGGRELRFLHAVGGELWQSFLDAGNFALRTDEENHHERVIEFKNSSGGLRTRVWELLLFPGYSAELCQVI